MANVNQTLRAVEAFFSAGNEVEATDYPDFLKNISQALDSIEDGETADPVVAPTPEPEPEVAVDKPKSATSNHPFVNPATADAKEAVAAPKEKKAKEKYNPIMPIEDSYGDDFVTCLICPTKNMKMLKNHLKKAHGLTPEEYRKELKLPDTHPIVAPAYTRLRSDAAKKNKLGEKMQAGKKKAQAKKAAKSGKSDKDSTSSTKKEVEPEVAAPKNKKSSSMPGPDFSKLNSPEDHL
jgi:predicted transcriptional regulator